MHTYTVQMLVTEQTCTALHTQKAILQHLTHISSYYLSILADVCNKHSANTRPKRTSIVTVSVQSKLQFSPFNERVKLRQFFTDNYKFNCLAHLHYLMVKAGILTMTGGVPNELGRVLTRQGPSLLYQI